MSNVAVPNFGDFNFEELRVQGQRNSTKCGVHVMQWMRYGSKDLDRVEKNTDYRLERRFYGIWLHILKTVHEKIFSSI
ncbi:unnamed protein product [Linum tenue]|uniref:Ubiquitin-like protease family profile domain-containing protein n=1 Tax=Linum tenue TaxID=586396 RepID=A0AAV0PWU0_9ROSI|nr:unnamed protein product [Linum tenue]